MVTRLFSFPARPWKPAVGRSGAFIALTSFITVSALPSVGCEKVPLTAPAGTVITLVASTNVLPINGTTDLTAVLIENGSASTGGGGAGGGTTTTSSAGTPVHNGTLVTFTTSLGRIEPAEARTSNGRVTVKLIADGRSGTATITAFSGGSSEALEVDIGAAAAATVTVSASPASVPANGGTVTISASVDDESGNPLLGVPVNFKTTSGTLTPASAVTNEGGIATTSLSTTANATVSATAGGKTGSATVQTRSRSTITITSPSDSVFVGAPARFTVTPGSGVAMADVEVDFGDGRTQSLGAISSAAVIVHFYEEDGVFPVSVRATDVDGGTAQATGAAAVIPWSFSVSASPTSRKVDELFTFSVSGISTTVPIDRYEWDFGDGTVRDTSTSSTTHGYGTVGLKTVRVTVFPLYGDARSATFQVQVTTTSPN